MCPRWWFSTFSESEHQPPLFEHGGTPSCSPLLYSTYLSVSQWCCYCQVKIFHILTAQPEQGKLWHTCTPPELGLSDDPKAGRRAGFIYSPSWSNPAPHSQKQRCTGHVELSYIPLACEGELACGVRAGPGRAVSQVSSLACFRVLQPCRWDNFPGCDRNGTCIVTPQRRSPIG